MSDAALPHFLCLGRLDGGFPRDLLGRLLVAKQLDGKWVRRMVRGEQIFDQGLDVLDAQLWAPHDRWLQQVCHRLGLPWPLWPGELPDPFSGYTGLLQPTYLVFGEVDEHVDGSLFPAGQGGPEGAYVNLQLRGAGHLHIWDEQGIRHSHRVGVGDLYVFDQRLTHAWCPDVATSSASGRRRLLSRAFSMVWPHAVVLDFARRQRAISPSIA